MSRPAKLSWLFFIGLIVCKLFSPGGGPPDPISAWMARHGVYDLFVGTCVAVIGASVVALVLLNRSMARDRERLEALRRLREELTGSAPRRPSGDPRPRR